VSFTYSDNNGAGDDTITASFTDANGTKQQATAIKHWVGATPPVITLTPAEATNPAGTSHTVTAHVTRGGEAVSGQAVTFAVTGQNNGATGVCSSPSPTTGKAAAASDCSTNSNGNVSFTYSDTNGAGDDTITASFTDGASGTTPQATAKKHWKACEPATVTMDLPIDGGSFKAPKTVTFSGHYSDNNGAGRSAHWVVTCNKKKGCTGTIDATVNLDGTMTAYFTFGKNSKAKYTAQLFADDGCGGTTSAPAIVFTIK
jgi:hypothetical protein